MLAQGRIPLTAEEHTAVQRLLEKHSGESVTLTRRDPGETGPVLVHAGNASYQVSEAGRATKLKAA
jgi:hypothetical protein